MDKTYILEHGILERYALGQLSSSEQAELEAALLHYPELKDQLEEIEFNFEQLGFDNAMEVPNEVKMNLLNEIAKDKDVVPTLKISKSKGYYFPIAASIAALLLIASIYTISELNKTKQQLQTVSNVNKKLNQQIEELNTSLEKTNNWYALINDPNTEKYVLKGNDLKPEAVVISYVNDAQKTVVINAEQLPELDGEHDYQMWADVEGVMVNMGLIDKSKDMIAMTYIDNAESLNITIEEKGGSDHPNVSQLVTNVYLR